MKYSYILGALASTAAAHSWVEQLSVIAPNGTLVGAPGFPRGNVKRGTPEFSDTALVNLIPPNPRGPNQIFDTDLMCKDSQTKQAQTGQSPRLQAAAGANVALRYQENGHVTLPETQAGKPKNRGTLYVYGTTQPQEDDKFLSIHRQWTADGQGGDKRGVLLSTRDYDDGQCYQVNGGQISSERQKTFAHTPNALMGADLWCQQDIQLPANAPSGKPYTLYWVWDWPTMPGTEGFPEGKQEIYTTCMDVDIVPGADTQQKSAGTSFAQGQDLGNAAVAAQLSDIANPTAVTGQSIPFQAASGTPSPTDNSGKQPSSTPAATTGQSSSQTSGFTSFAGETAPAATATSTNGGNSQQQGPSDRRGGGHRSQHDGNGSYNPNAQNTGTAIQNGNAAPATTTATVTGPVSTVTEVQTAMQTITQTKMQTVTANAKRNEPATQAPSPTEYPSIRDVESSTACSKTESAYKLRARNPFYILPKDATESGAGC
ncbi:hypothetical protein PMZ80_002526 [Knufia obscura]|uniref:DUF7492 domain-containing protein n=2 Tax=Knufia TaxID=430999 RepID=A0AAN8I5S4_9EURO|nr:hypothetical protein PMZ80_002526 [Knufia obscura]KAK5950766.1 hypothetical protein OHC33_008149 [Knufia fluminis]